MAERLETNWQNRLEAAGEAITLLDRAGFYVGSFEIEEDPADAVFNIDVDLSVGEDTYPLESLEDEPDEDFGRGFRTGFFLGLMTDTE